MVKDPYAPFLFHSGIQFVKSGHSFPVMGMKVKIAVQNDDPSAFFQDPFPLPIRFRRVGERPGNASADHHVKAFIRKIRLLTVHDEEFGVKLCRPDILGCFPDHVFRYVDPDHPMPSFAQWDGEKSRTGPAVQDLRTAFPRRPRQDQIRPGLLLRLPVSQQFF